MQSMCINTKVYTHVGCSILGHKVCKARVNKGIEIIWQLFGGLNNRELFFLYVTVILSFYMLL
jgi:hypothetical protein